MLPGWPSPVVKRGTGSDSRSICYKQSVARFELPGHHSSQTAGDSGTHLAMLGLRYGIFTNGPRPTTLAAPPGWAEDATSGSRHAMRTGWALIWALHQAKEPKVTANRSPHSHGTMLDRSSRTRTRGLMTRSAACGNHKEAGCRRAPLANIE